MLERIFRNYIAGSKRDGALKKLRELQGKNIQGIINYLGEHLNEEQKLKSFKEYSSLILNLEEGSEISIKLSQVSLGQVEALVDLARKIGIFVWFDMEDWGTKKATIDTYLNLRRKYDEMGIALQAYLRDTSKDMQRILKQKGKIRLCKGGYTPPKKLLVDDVRKNMEHLINRLFVQGVPFAVATNNKRIIEETIRLSKRFETPFEFQFLMGQSKKLKRKLIEEGFVVKDYIPYGTHVYPYVKRRIMQVFRL